MNTEKDERFAIGDRVRILTCPGRKWRGGIGTVIAVGAGTLTVMEDGAEDGDLPSHGDVDDYELMSESGHQDPASSGESK